MEIPGEIIIKIRAAANIQAPSVSDSRRIMENHGVAGCVGFWHFYRRAHGERREIPLFFSVHLATLAVKIIQHTPSDTPKIQEHLCTAGINGILCAALQRERHFAWDGHQASLSGF
jgi:hypothetical protein